MTLPIETPTTAASSKPLAVRIPEAARMIGIGRSTFYLLIAAGEIETFKIGSATLVPVTSLEAFVVNQRR